MRRLRTSACRSTGRTRRSITATEYAPNAVGKEKEPSFPRTRESIFAFSAKAKSKWIPACAGMTALLRDRGNPMRSTPRIKICCIASLDEARLAIRCGADALGLVSAMPSGPGPIDEATIAEIAAQVPPPIATFLLTCLTDADAIIAQQRR